MSCLVRRACREAASALMSGMGWMAWNEGAMKRARVCVCVCQVHLPATAGMLIKSVGGQHCPKRTHMQAPLCKCI